MPKTKKPVAEPERLMPESVSNPAKTRSTASYLPWALIALVILIAGYFVYNQQQQANSLKQELTELKQNPQNATEEETKVLLEKVGQLIELPNEQPTIATVTDLASLKDQPFFDNAQMGDKVLIYTAAKKAFLYRPSTNKVIEVAPVNLDAPAANVNTNTKASTNKNTNSSSNTNTSTRNTNTNSGSNSNTNLDEDNTNSN